MVKNTTNMKWYDVKTKKKWIPKDYKVEIKGNRRFGVAKNPKSGTECWRVLGMK